MQITNMVRRVNHVTDNSLHRLLILQIWFVRLTWHVITKWREKEGLDNGRSSIEPEEIEKLRGAASQIAITGKIVSKMGTPEQREFGPAACREQERSMAGCSAMQ